jgi:acetyl esterase/lipase
VTDRDDRRGVFRIVLAASAVLLFISAWIVVPPVHRLVYALSVASQELAPALLASAGVLAIFSSFHARRRRIARVSVIFAAAASGLALMPVMQFSIALARFERSMTGTTAEPPSRSAGPIRVTRGLRFSNADGVPLALDVYQPSASGPRPIIMQIYGGAWQSGAPANQEWFSRHFAEQGYVVVAIDYRHAPEWKWPEQIVDVRTALYWISEEAHRYGGDASRIVLVGRSAGAQLAMRLAYQEGPSSIRGVVNYYGPVDLVDGWRRPPRPDPLNVRGILETFIGGTPDAKPEHYRHASPITWVSKGSAPTLSIYGSRDHIVDPRFGRLLDAALKRAGATSVLLELPWSDHSFDAVRYGMGRYVALRYTERFVAWAVNR